MKKIFAIIALTFVAFINAQTKFGINAGTMFLQGRVKIHNNLNKSTGDAYYGGVFAEIPIDDKNFKLFASANYANNEGDTYLYTPIYFKAYIFQRFNLQAGTSLMTYLEELPDEVNRLHLALTAGLGIDITKNLMVDARYNYQTNDLLKDSSRSNSIKFNYINMGLAYRF